MAQRSRTQRESPAAKAALQKGITGSEAQEEVTAMKDPLDMTGEEWAAERENRARLQGMREVLRVILEERFQTVPEIVLKRMEACTDPEKLDTCVRKAVHVITPEELPI